MFKDNKEPLRQYSRTISKHGAFSEESLYTLLESPQWFLKKIVNINSIEIIFRSIFNNSEESKEALINGIFIYVPEYLVKSKKARLLNTLEETLFKNSNQYYILNVVTAMSVFYPSMTMDALLVYLKHPNDFKKCSNKISKLEIPEKESKEAYLIFLNLSKIDIENNLILTFRDSLTRGDVK